MSRRPPPPTPSSFDSCRRESGASSICSNRSNNPSAAANAALLNDKPSQSAALKSINSYISSLNAPFSLKTQYPSARDIENCFRFLLDHLDFPVVSYEDDVILFLKSLSCPVKLTRSHIKSPSTPHSWPPIVSALYWIVQLARYSDESSSSSLSSVSNNDLLDYCSRSYCHFIRCEDDAISELDGKYLAMAQQQADNTVAAFDALAREEEELAAKLSSLRSGPSRKEVLEKEKAVLEEDVAKFVSVAEKWEKDLVGKKGKVVEKEKELAEKEAAVRRIRGENEGLRRRVEGQVVGVRDAERMKKEMEVVERDTAETELGRNVMEEKAWELEAEIGRKFTELEYLAEQCNQVMRKLKLGSDLQYVLNAKGSTPAEVLGIDHKTKIKPSLAAISEDTKQASVSKLEELIALRQQSRENATVLEEKRVCLASLQAKVAETEAHYGLVKKEIEDYAAKCAIEAEELTKEFTEREHQFNILVMEAEEYLKISEQKLLDAKIERDKETKLCVGELLKTIDAVSAYKERIESLTTGIKTDVAELAHFMSNAYKKKRARSPSPNP